jgi:FHA domain
MGEPEAIPAGGEAADAPAAASLTFRGPEGAWRVVPLPEAGSMTVGRREEADLSLPWDSEVSRLHAELSLHAGEWTVTDDGWSQNGTWVNGIRIAGRRRLADGDLITVGKTVLTFRGLTRSGPGPTMVPGELGAAPAFSEQQQRVLRALCGPLLGDGEGVAPASDEEVASATGIPLEQVESELELLAQLFGFEVLPLADRRGELALLALRSGLVS